MSAEPVPEPVAFGDRYQLQRQLAVGGMAEIYLARQVSAEGFEKEVVVKRLKPELARDPRVARMFVDEARVGALLGHPHVVQVFDVGVHEGVPYIVMEHIRGEELNVLCRRGLGAGDFLPLAHAVDLVRQAALGLGYVHNLCDASGAPLEVVHCDISPTNLLVTEDGFLQIIDFGIAQFRGQRYRDEQVVPGKLSYMAPEQARREPLDRRADVFSLGVVLYEITLGRRLFRGPAREVYDRLSRGDVQPPTFVRQDYPGALESIVLRALELDRTDRYQEAYDLADDLGRFLLEEGVRTGPVALARYLDRLAVAGGGTRREELIPEGEGEDDDALDFDRGLFAGYRAVTEADPSAAQDWEELEEGEDAVADALGISVDLVRTASRAADAQPIAPGPERARGRRPEPEPEPDPELEPERQPEPEPEPPPAAAAESAHGLVLLAFGLLLGVAGSAVVYLLFLT